MTMKKNETKEQQKERIAKAVANEVKGYQASKLPNEIIALKIYESLIQALIRIENLQEQLEVEIKQVVKASKTN